MRLCRLCPLPTRKPTCLRDGAVVGFIALLGDEIGGLFRDNVVWRPFYERDGFEFVAEELHEPSGQISRKMAMPVA